MDNRESSYSEKKATTNLDDAEVSTLALVHAEIDYVPYCSCFSAMFHEYGVSSQKELTSANDGLVFVESAHVVRLIMC
jgi:hypothetical protein